jgi:hypothetical protein
LFSIAHFGIVSAQSNAVIGNNSPSKEYYSVYPNPAHNHFYITYQSTNNERSCTVTVLNIIGQSIYTIKLVGDENGFIKHQVLLSSDTPKGIYFVKFDDEVSDYKIVRLKIE